MTTGKPDDIPEDVWTQAMRTVLDPVSHIQGIATAILVATAAEREACALIADGVKAYMDAEYEANPKDGPFAVRGGSLASKHIAAAIRKRGEG